MIIFSFLAAGILGLGYYFYEYQVTNFQHAKEEELSSIVDLKVKQIVTWRQELLSDAQLIFGDRNFAHDVQDWFSGKGSPEQENNVRQRLDELYQGSYVEVILFDVQGNVKLSMSKVIPDHQSVIRLTALKAMLIGKIFLSDLYFLHKFKDINMSLAIPIQVHINNKSTVIGAVVFQIDPYYLLYPLLQSWPTPSKTAELVMIRRDTKNNKIILS